MYRLLLWIDRTTGLAHCYESDKSQPGRHWYARSLAFHKWVAQALRTTPGKLAEEIDWLFRKAIDDFVRAVERQKESLTAAARRQRAPFEGMGFPEPGEDPELVLLISDTLEAWLSASPPPDVWRLLTERIRAHLTQENKRRNLVGEGFEDVLAATTSRVTGSSNLDVRTRLLLHEIPGFNPPRANEKPKKVDLAVVNRTSSYRTLVTAKWSIRADREEQFVTDLEAYARLEAAGEDFHYTLVTNEFDAARLLAACERRSVNRPLFTNVVHLNTEALMAVYGGEPQHSARRVAEQVQSGRLMSLADWLRHLKGPE